jgi:hypothetical protein
VINGNAPLAGAVTADARRSGNAATSGWWSPPRHGVHPGGRWPAGGPVGGQHTRSATTGDRKSQLCWPDGSTLDLEWPRAEARQFGLKH